MGTWQDEAQTLSARFYPEVREAFRFLESNYGYRFVEEKLMWPGDYRDTWAQVTFAGEHIGVLVGWYFSSGYVWVWFRKLQTAWHYPEGLNEEEQISRLPVQIDLDWLARFLGTEQDPDFLLQEPWNVYVGIKKLDELIKKHDALIKSNMRGVLDGLARATERYASHILRGDTSQFAEVTAFYEAHKDDRWQRKKK